MLSAALICLVVGISDGDTLTARCGQPGQYEQVKVRLQGIDAPERKQPFSNRAREALSDLTYMKEAELRCNKMDRYKRHVCNVWVAAASAANGPRTLDAGSQPAWPGGIEPTQKSNHLKSAVNMSLRNRKQRHARLACGVIQSQSRHGAGARVKGRQLSNCGQ